MFLPMSHTKATSLRYAKLRSLSIAGLILGAIFLIPALGFAQPASDPPGGNVDAQFDTVTVGPSLFDYFIGPAGGSDTEITTRGNMVVDMNAGLGTMLFEEPGNTGVYTLGINPFGLNGADNNVVNVNDALRVNGSTGQLLTGYGQQSFVVEDPSGAYMELGENGIYVNGPGSAGPYGDTGIYVTNGGGNAIFAYGTGTTTMQAQGTGSIIGSFYNLTSQTSSSLSTSSGVAGNFTNVATGSGAVLADNNIGVNAVGSSFGVMGEDSNSGGVGYLGYGSYGVYGNGPTTGGYFRDQTDSGYAWLGYGDTGVRGYGDSYGGYFQDTNATAGYAYVGYGNSGIQAHGSTYGGYFNDTNSDGYAYLAYGDRGIDATGSYTGGTFRNTSGPWVDLATSSSGIITNNGNVYKPGGGSWAVWSDERLKDVHGAYTHGLAEILKLKPVEYNYKKDNPQKMDSSVDYVGLIAQDVQDVFPEAIDTGDDGYLTLDMHPISVAVINAIQELSALLDGDVAELQKQIDEQQSEIDALKNIVCDIKPEHAECQ